MNQRESVSLLILFFAACDVAFAQTARPGAPGPDELLVRAITQEVEGPLRKLRGAVHLETTEMYLKADEIDYNEETGGAEARGNVRYHSFTSGEDLECDRVEYNLREETGKFYEVRGSAPAKVQARQGVLTTSNPFSFQGKWAERIKNSYILHDGFITNCKLPKPWWRLEGPKFDVRPGERALAYRAVFRVNRVPIFYMPVFYKSLEKMPRRSGFLTPNIGNSSRRGKMLGGGYYWAINRSLDVMYRTQWFTQRGFSHNVDFRGKPTRTTDFNMALYGVNDKGLKLDDGERLKQGGFQINLDGRTQIGKGFAAHFAPRARQC